MHCTEQNGPSSTSLENIIFKSNAFNEYKEKYGFISDVIGLDSAINVILSLLLMCLNIINDNADNEPIMGVFNDLHLQLYVPLQGDIGIYPRHILEIIKEHTPVGKNYSEFTKDNVGLLYSRNCVENCEDIIFP